MTPLPPNSSFSSKLPTLQLAIDSTSLGTFKECPRKYQLSILLGFQPRLESVHLTWGLLLHGAVERYWHLRYRAEWQFKVGSTTYQAPLDHQEALIAIVHWALETTWNRTTNSPWNSDHRTKNRFTLLRTIVWYLDDFQNDPIETIRLSNGKPAVELSFSFDSSVVSKTTEEPIIICGHMDRLGLLNSVPYTIDIKSTEQTIDTKWFRKFTPDNQFTVYTVAGRVVYQQPTAGIIVDGVQTAVGFSRFQRGLVERSEYQIDDWFRGLKYYLELMEKCATDNYWPQDDKSCGMYGGCQFRPVCSQKSESSATDLLQGTYTRRVWDPLQRRGDI